MKIKVILNPYANRWGAKSKVAEVKAAFDSVKLPIDLVVTEGPGDGTRIAKTAVSKGYDVVIAAGGDGTISEIVNGLIAATPVDKSTVPFGIMPIGTANDFGDMVGVPRDLSVVAKAIANGNTRQIDIGRISLPENHHQQNHYFNNNCAVAMEPMVTLEHIKMTRLSGEIRYVVALIRALVKLKAWNMKITWDGGGYEGPTYLLSICNTARTGGFLMAPGAKYDDGLLDFVLAPEVSKFTVLAVLARLFRGTHVHHSDVTFLRTTNLVIESYPGTPMHADGEIITEKEKSIKIDILPGKLTLLTP